MQNIPEGLIPYNHELYLTGKYIAETRGGFSPPQVVKMEGAKQPIIYISSQRNACSCFDDGVFYIDKSKSVADLFLRPKMVKKWTAVFSDDLFFETKVECENHFSGCMYHTFLKAVEVEVNEE